MGSEPIKEQVYDFLRDMPCLLCKEPEAYVVGSFVPESPTPNKSPGKKPPMLYYALCKKCFNNGRIPTSRIESVYRQKMATCRMDAAREEPKPKRVTMA